jgi:exodeoxyribonuclease-5
VTDEFVKDSEYAKIIAWRNKTVSTMNAIIRKAIYGEISETSKILNGEKLIANNPVIQDDAVILNTNEEFTVESFSLNSEELSLIISENPDDDTMKVNLKYYDTIVSLVDDDGDLIKYNIEILHEDSEHEFQKVANILKLKAIQTKGRNKSWIRYYGFIRRYADVNFAYAISCHKSQGSTYNTTFVLDDDIDMNWNIVERNRIKYTAYTRASRKLYVLKRF